MVCLDAENLPIVSSLQIEFKVQSRAALDETRSTLKSLEKKIDFGNFLASCHTLA